jgi:hypothetical protein
MPVIRLTPTTAKLLQAGALFVIVLAAGSPAGAQSSKAKESAEDRGRFAGTYRCMRLEMDQKMAPCQSPPLTLNEDGSYQIWGEEGSYELVQNRWLILEHSQRRGLGQIVSAREIVFEYRVGSKRCKVTFQRVFDPPPGYSLS